MRQHDYLAAVDSFANEVALNPASPEPLIDLSEAQAAAGEFDKASSLLKTSIKRYPREAQFYYQYALLILYHSSNFDAATKQSKAMALLETVLKLDDSNAGAHYELGNLWLNRGQPAKALEELERAEELNPSDENTHYALWLALHKLGRAQQAEDELQAFRKLKAQSNGTVR